MFGKYIIVYRFLWITVCTVYRGERSRGQGHTRLTLPLNRPKIGKGKGNNENRSSRMGNCKPTVSSVNEMSVCSDGHEVTKWLVLLWFLLIEVGGSFFSSNTTVFRASKCGAKFFLA